MTDRATQQKILETMGIASPPPNRNRANMQTRMNPAMMSNRAEAIAREDAGDAYGGDGSLVYQSEKGIEQAGPDFYELPFDRAMEAMSVTSRADDPADAALAALWNDGDAIVRERVARAIMDGYGMRLSDDIAEDTMNTEMKYFIENLDNIERSQGQ